MRAARVSASGRRQRRRILLAVALVAGLGTELGTASALLAQPMGGPGMMMQDPYGDATVARKDAEAQAAARFAAMDANGDGVLTPDELRAMRRDRRGGEPGGPDGPGPGMGGGMGGGMARMLDADGDGKVSREEFVAGNLRLFDRGDADHDGLLTKAERQAAMEAMRARMEERMREMMGGGGE